jgi:hypothetical protein
MSRKSELPRRVGKERPSSFGIQTRWDEDCFLHLVEETFGDWSTAEDCEAFRSLSSRPKSAG